MACVVSKVVLLRHTAKSILSRAQKKMNKLSFLIVLFILACIGNEVYVYLNSRSDAFQNYKDYATEMAYENRRWPPFSSIEGSIVNVVYTLVSLEHEENDVIRLVAYQSVHFRKDFSLLKVGDMDIAKTRHDVLMTQEDGSWQVVELLPGLTEVKSLRDSVELE